MDIGRHEKNVQELGSTLERGGSLSPELRGSYLNSLAWVAGLAAAVDRAEWFTRQRNGSAYDYFHLAILRAVEDEDAASKWLLDEVKARSRDPIFLHAGGVFLSDIGLNSESMKFVENAALSSNNLDDLINQFVFSSMFSEVLDQVDYLVRLKRLTKFHFNAAPQVQLHRLGRPRYVLGFVTAAFNQHALIHFLEPLLRNLDRKKFFVIVFCSERNEGAHYAHLQSLVDMVYDVRSMTHGGLLELVRRERVDVLIDLDHFTKGNRLWVFAQRAAPIQMTMYGMHTTTGLEAMDYRVTDARIDVAGCDAHYSETLLRTGRGHFASTLLAPVSRAVSAPFSSNGFLTFGSFNGWRKINRRVVGAWSELLLSFPDSRMKLVGIDSYFASVRLARWFSECGVAASRVEMHDRVGAALLHEHIRSVDLALDTWPYGGGVTTAMILELGTPVATISGDRAVSRMGESMLKDVDIGELCADSPETFSAVISTVIRKDPSLSSIRARVASRFPETLGNAKACADSVAELILEVIGRAKEARK